MIEPYYQDDCCTIYNARCEDVLPFLEPVDLVLTDPPYGICEAKGKNKSRTKLAIAKDYGVENWDDNPPSTQLIDQIRAMGKWNILFGGNYFELPPTSCWLVWDKDNTGDFADCELAWTNLKKAVRKLRWRWNGMLQERGGDRKEYRQHPTQKPLAVMKWCIQQAPDDTETILDPFMGSGTTLVAAKLLGKKAIGIEISQEYCDIAIQRLRQGVLQFTG